MMNVSASIVIPVYNAEKTLRKCVESIVYGDTSNIEIILVDDCSKDKSWKLCQDLSNQYKEVKCIQNPVNSGVSYTRNNGISQATGKWILFVDSDDWVSHTYVSQIISNAENNKSKLVICGFHYVDFQNNCTTDYTWNTDKEEYVDITPLDFFDALDKIMLQNVWNKAFIRQTIINNSIKFDETQNMGEDFKFVLDYMLTAKINHCLIINQALYYYVKANNTSLMGNYGWSTNSSSVKRIKELAEICRINNVNVVDKVQEQIDRLKKNSIYHVVRTPNRTKNEKVNRINQILESNKGKLIYNEERYKFLKEKISRYPIQIKKMYKRIIGRFEREQRNILIKYQKAKIHYSDVSIISQNCIGGVLYHDLEHEFLSPTIDLFFSAQDFVKFVINLEVYINMELKIFWEETYPVGILGDLKIHFMHYTNCSEAKAAWERRKQRINYDKILVLSTDRNGFDQAVYSEWKKIYYPKVLFTVHSEFEAESTVVYSEFKECQCVPDLIPKRLFYKNGTLIDTINRMR